MSELIKVRANSVPENIEYITEGEVYDALCTSDNPDDLYLMLSDADDTLFIKLKDCAHLEGGDWEVVE